LTQCRQRWGGPLRSRPHGRDGGRLRRTPGPSPPPIPSLGGEKKIRELYTHKKSAKCTQKKSAKCTRKKSAKCKRKKSAKCTQKKSAKCTRKKSAKSTRIKQQAMTFSKTQKNYFLKREKMFVNSETSEFVLKTLEPMGVPENIKQVINFSIFSMFSRRNTELL
jgi:hypothetical protein